MMVNMGREANYLFERFGHFLELLVECGPVALDLVCHLVCWVAEIY